MIRNYCFLIGFGVDRAHSVAFWGVASQVSKKHDIRNTFGGLWRRSQEELGSKTADRTHYVTFCGVTSQNDAKNRWFLICFYNASELVKNV